jgi:tetratricopeptide (TPR) repeat protein
MSDYDRAIAIRSQDDNSYNNRGALYYTLKNYEKALENYNLAIKFNP